MGREGGAVWRGLCGLVCACMLSGIGLPTIYLESNVHSAHLFQLCAACGRGETNKLKNLAHVLKHVDPVSRIHNTFIHMLICTTVRVHQRSFMSLHVFLHVFVQVLVQYTWIFEACLAWLTAWLCLGQYFTGHLSQADNAHGQLQS